MSQKDGSVARDSDNDVTVPLTSQSLGDDTGSYVDSKFKVKNGSARSGRDAQPTVAAAPDGGIGWLVLFSAFSISMLVDGVCFSFGIFFDDFRKEFNTSKATTSWIGSVLNGSYLIVGPLVSILVNLYGCRRVAMCGAVMASIAFFVSTFSTNIGLLIFTYGFLGGVGFGLMYLPSIVIVGYYFEKRRALATGVACCGSGIGAFLFAPFTEFLLNEYDWRGALWILSALVLNGFIFGTFYRPIPSQVQPTNGDVEGLPSSPRPTPSQSNTSARIDVLGPSEERDEQGQGQGNENFLLADISLGDNSEGDRKRGTPMSNITVVSSPTPTSIYRTRSVTLYDSTEQDASSARGALVRLTQSQDLSTLTPRRRYKAKPQTLTVASPLQRKDIFYSGSLSHIKEFMESKGSLDEFRRNMLTTSQEVTIISDDENTKKTQTSLSQAVFSLFDFSLLKSPTFVIYGMSCFLCMAGFFVPFIYMPTYAMDMGYDSTQAAMLISIIGITNTVGRVAVGFISDQPWADCLLINNVALAIGGVATIFVPYFIQYYVLAVYAAVFGSSIAVFVSLRSIIMVELMGIEKLTTAFGLVIMCQGVSSLLGAPIAGALSDITGNYNASFYMAGITLTLSGLICLPLRRVSRWEQARNKSKASAHTAESSTKQLNAARQSTEL